MRIIETKAYKLAELSPEARAHAFQKYQDAAASWEMPWGAEMMDSLKAVCAAASVTIRDYDLGAYNRGNMLRVTIPGDDAAAELTGARAFAWLENNLFGALRIVARPLIKDGAGGRTRYYRIRAGGGLAQDATRRRGHVGEIPSCPLTGYCMDDDYLEDLKKSIRGGRTIKEAFEDLADVYARQAEAECEYQQSEEAFEMWADGVEFDEDGGKL